MCHEIFNGVYKDVLKEFQRYFKKVSRVFQWVSRVLKQVQREFQGTFKGVSRVFQWSFKVVSWDCQRDLKFLSGCSEGLSQGFHGYLRGPMLCDLSFRSCCTFQIYLIIIWCFWWSSKYLMNLV